MYIYNLCKPVKWFNFLYKGMIFMAEISEEQARKILEKMDIRF